MSLRSFKYAILAAPFLLTACGDGYELIRTDTMFPYGNQRTAGSGVAYVLAKMMPEKELKLEPAGQEKSEVAPVPEEEEDEEEAKELDEPKAEMLPPPAKDGAMDKLFDEAVKK